MKIFAITITLAALILPLAGQSNDQPSQEKQNQLVAEPSPSPARVSKKTPARTAQKPRAKSQPTAVKDENTAFEAASAVGNPTEKLAALKKFTEDFPNSTHLEAARGLIITTAISSAEDKLLSSDIASAAELYKSAINSAPQPIPDALFTDSLGKIPSNVYWRGFRPEALDIAKVLETKIDKNAGQLLALATFYLGIENGDEGSRLAEMAVALDPNSSAAYLTLGMARRVNFQLEESAAAYAKALEIAPDSAAAKRSLAEMKRALGKADEALPMYRELIAADPSDIQSRTGLVMSLFDAGKRADAETELSAALDQNSNNVMLLAGAAYWYAAHNEPDKAVEFGRKAVAVEPRYIWSHIALARGLMGQNRAVEAEEELLRSRQYGQFPTVDYEIAAARLKAGFYRDAAEILEKSFSVTDGAVQTRLGTRVQRSNASFVELLAAERRASILEPAAADEEDTAVKLKALLIFQTKLKGTAEPSEVAAAADAFAAGDDKMKLHREIYAASALLDKGVAADKALELTKAAIGNTDTALDVPNVSAAVMASELYDARTAAISSDQFLAVPDVPRQMLSAILRGRVEELAGRALLQQNNSSEAVVRLRRAVSVMPPKSAWWRSSMWRLGDALATDGKEKEALDSYISSYSIDKPDLARHATIEALYKKLNGTTEGLEAKIGSSPLPNGMPAENVAQKTEKAPVPRETPTPMPAPVIESSSAPVRFPRALPVAAPTPTPVAVVSAPPTASPSPETTSVPTATTSPEAQASPSASQEKTPEPEPSATIEPSPTPASSPAGTPESTPLPAPAVMPTPEAAATPSPEAAATVTPAPEPSPTTEPAASQSPASPPAATPVATPEQSPGPTFSPTPEITPSPAAAPTPLPEPTATPQATSEPNSSPLPAASEPTATPDMKTVADNIPPDKPPVATGKSPEPSPEPPPAATTEQSASQTARDSRSVGPPKVVITENIPPGITSRSSKPLSPSNKGLGPLVVGIPKAGDNKPSDFATEKTEPPSATPSDKTLAENAAAETNPKAAQVQVTDGLNNGKAAAAADERPRVVKDKEVMEVALPQCSVTTSDERLILMKNGGSLGVLVAVGIPGDLGEVRGTPSSPDDLSVTREAAIAGLEDRAVFSIKAVSSRPGNYKVVFEVPCGRHQITVSVR